MGALQVTIQVAGSLSQGVVRLASQWAADMLAIAMGDFATSSDITGDAAAACPMPSARDTASTSSRKNGRLCRTLSILR